MLEVGGIQRNGLDLDENFVAGDAGRGNVVLNTTPCAAYGLSSRGIEDAGDDAAVGLESLHGV